MVFKDVLKKKIPKDIQFTPEFKVLLAVVKRKDIRGASSLKTHVNAEIRNCREWIKTNQKQSMQGTMRRHLKRHNDKLDFYELVNKKILRYL